MLSPSGVQVSTRKLKCVLVVISNVSHPSSASRFTAGPAGFFILSQLRVRPEV